MISNQRLTRIEQEQFTQALALWETSLETPFVPGELERWIAAARASYDGFAPLWRQRRQRLHEAEFEEISEEDPELLQRVEEMREEDAEIDRQLTAIGERIAAFEKGIAKVEPDEGRIDDELAAFADAALAEVIRVRKQELALRTWLVEAFERDCGDGD
jgi:septal ring factor EnvC (AmiA/AmiB activator)